MSQQQRKLTLKSRLARGINSVLSGAGMRLVYESRAGEPTARELRLRLFRQLAALGFAPQHIIDVGAHKAAWSRDARSVFGDCRFTLIEPQIEMKPQIDAFCQEAKQATWILGGAGAESGELPLTLSPQLDGRSLAGSAEEAAAHGWEQRIVPVVTLDQVCRDGKLPIPEIVKIDAERLELDVMRGSTSLIGKSELFFLELPLFDFSPDQSFHSIIEFMRERDYEPYDITELNRRKHDGALGLVEMAFARRDGKLRQHHGW